MWNASITITTDRLSQCNNRLFSEALWRIGTGSWSVRLRWWWSREANLQPYRPPTALSYIMSYSSSSSTDHRCYRIHHGHRTYQHHQQVSTDSSTSLNLLVVSCFQCLASLRTLPLLRCSFKNLNRTFSGNLRLQFINLWLDLRLEGTDLRQPTKLTNIKLRDEWVADPT